jgi:uncharacterized protein YoxC
MRKLPNFNLLSITTIPQALSKIETQVKKLAGFIDTNKELTEDDKAQLVKNIDWLKRYYERAEKVIAEHE